MTRDYIETVEWLVKHWISVLLIIGGVFGLLFLAAHQPTGPVQTYSFGPLWTFLDWAAVLYVIYVCARWMYKLGPDALLKLALVPLYVFHFYSKHHRRMKGRHA